MTTDDNIYKWYMRGFEDELQGSTMFLSGQQLELKAYKMGCMHAIVGDDVRSVDYLSKKQIIKMVKEE